MKEKVLLRKKGEVRGGLSASVFITFAAINIT